MRSLLAAGADVHGVDITRWPRKCQREHIRSSVTLGLVDDSVTTSTAVETGWMGKGSVWEARAAVPVSFQQISLPVAANSIHSGNAAGAGYIVTECFGRSRIAEGALERFSR